MSTHKYLDELNEKYKGKKGFSHIPNPVTLDLIKDSRYERFYAQRRKYGFDERETWALNFTFYAWLYEHLKMYKDVCCVDLTYHKFEYKGKTLTQEECIDKIIEGCEIYLAFDDCGWGEYTDEQKEKVDDVIALWGIILPAMWW